MKLLKLPSIIITCIFLCFSAFLAFRTLASFVITPWDKKGDPSYQFIAHEGGGIDGYTYTSSKEAVELALSKGFKLIELDLIETVEGSLIGGHDWTQFKQITGQKNQNDTPMSRKDTCNLKIHGKYSVLCADDIRLLLSSNPNFHLVTDKTNNFKLINSLGAKDRIFVEVFGAKNYIKSIFYGINRPLYSLSVGRFGEFAEFLIISLLNPKYVALNTDTAANHSKLIDWIHARGIKIFIFTSNDSAFINWAQSKYDATIYTDFWNPSNGKCEGIKCK